MGKNPSRMVYKRKWRQTDKKRKHHNAFISEYVKVKFGNLYNEANCFFNALTAIHPEKLDLKKTNEFQQWKKSIINTENSEACIITQTLRTDVSYEENHHDDSHETEKDGSDESEKDDSDESEKDDSDESEKDDSDESEKDDSDESEKDDSDEKETGNNQENHHDNMLLEIPLERYLPRSTQHETAQVPNNSSSETEPPFSNDYDFEPFSDERFQQIVAELRDDPELQNLFYPPAENPSDEEDEGVELRTPEEELEVDIEPFDYWLEVELSDW